jgi:hypothetical protein
MGLLQKGHKGEEPAKMMQCGNAGGAGAPGGH